MKKNEKSKKKERRTIGPIFRAGKIDWTPLLDAAEGGVIWAHELALDACPGNECLAIERTFRAIYALVDGKPIDRVPLHDLLTTVGVIGRAVERDQDMAAGGVDLFVTMLGFALAQPGGESIGTPRVTPITPLRSVFGNTPPSCAAQAASVPCAASAPRGLIGALVDRLRSLGSPALHIHR